MISRIFRPIRDGFKGVGRHASMSIQSASAVTLALIIISLLFFAYTNNTIFENSNGDIVNCTYSTINLILNSLFIITSVAIIEISIISIKKLPKDKNDYNKALVISNIILGTILNLFIVLWPITQYLLECR